MLILEMGIRVQLTEVLRILIDTTEPPERDDFLTLFYNEGIQKLMEAFNEKTDIPDSSKEAICEILGFCVTHHGYRIKYFLLGNNILAKVLSLLHRKEKHLVLGTIFTPIHFLSSSTHCLLFVLCWSFMMFIIHMFDSITC
jgi:protein phosphatase-4 regulatory subunit 3